MLTDDELARIGSQGEWLDYRLVPMARELLAARECVRELRDAWADAPSLKSYDEATR